MTFRHAQMLTARLLFLGYILFTASYCLLGYIPFTYQQVLVGELLPSVTRLAHMHRGLFWPAFACALWTIVADLKGGPARYLARGFACLGVVAGVALLIHPLLPSLTNDVSSLWWCVVSLVPLLWLATIDWISTGALVAWDRQESDDSSRTFLACLQAALFLTLTYCGIAIVRAWSNQVHPSVNQDALVFGWTLISHMLVLVLIFVVLDWISIIAAWLPDRWQCKAVTVGSWLALAAMLGLVLRYVIFPPLAFNGAAAGLVAAMLSASLVSFAIGLSVRIWDTGRHTNRGGIDLALGPLCFLRSAPPITRGLTLMVLAGLAWILSARTSRLDWEFVVQKMAVILIWTAALAIFYTITPKMKRFGRPLVYAAATVVLIGYSAVVARIQKEPPKTGLPVAMGVVLEQYSGYDISFRFVNEILRPGNDGRTSDSTDSLYAFLADNTHIPRSIHLRPTDIKLVGQLARSTHRRPHIFFFVIDSLRRDYVGAYNEAVTFTPALDALAQDSVVFKNAFTHYGGTGLSEPSIWVGGLLLHQQYTTPFGPMNSLQKLLDVNGYREWISKDNILQQVVPASPNIAELDAHVGAMSYDLCRTLKELEGRLSTVTNTDHPVFVYTQAQNIHVSVIDRADRSVPGSAVFPPGFDAAYASRVQTIDSCFGEFIGSLKKAGIYDDSVIVVTSDHGDSLGEMGRWGHAYTIFPEIIRIPLILHLPTWLNQEVGSSPNAVTFLTDVTPSLYYLLGYRPVVNNPIFGRPLFTVTPEEQEPYLRDSYLLVSSYAPVYGLLTHNGRNLYIADGVNFRDSSYVLNTDGTSKEESVDDNQKVGYRNSIRKQVEAISAFYRPE